MVEYLARKKNEPLPAQAADALQLLVDLTSEAPLVDARHRPVGTVGGPASESDWRTRYMERMDGTDEAKRKAYSRAKKLLLSRGRILEATGALWLLGEAPSGVLMDFSIGAGGA